ncbi:uncharacterized protein L201_005928 [Kwoniella dendrophila CBS 6074]|uniref:Major facilitator superfamily (MFS) profile domain-containing protein n=1 Tax=Kwoniella dendrophila CBS 6074 TaxID=1295534 RepID=A0AAX4K0T2_9TREE
MSDNHDNAPTVHPDLAIQTTSAIEEKNISASPVDSSPTIKKDIQYLSNEDLVIQSELPLLPLNGNFDRGNQQEENQLQNQNQNQNQNQSRNITIKTKLYKRRFIPLISLSLLNIIVSWCWLSFSSISKTSSQFFSVSENSINWLSTGFLFAFFIASPASLWSLNKLGIKKSLIIASGLLILGNWLRYLSSKLSSHSNSNTRFGILLLGQIVIGFSQPIILSSPTRLSNTWFNEKGRITATALATLCNPLGGALGQLLGPILAPEPSKIPDMILYVAIITTIICIPTLFIPSAPPLPPTTTPITNSKIDLRTLRTLFTNLSFHMVAWPFIVYVAAFNSTSSLLNQILEPYGLSEDQAGIDGAVLIVIGLLAAAIASPILDRFCTSNQKLKLIIIKGLVLIICFSYLAMIFIPLTKGLIGPAIISGFLGGSSFILLPLSLELLVDFTYPLINPEISSTVCWSLSQLFGGILLLIMSNLKGNKGWKSQPENTLYRSLVFQSVICFLVAPLPLCLGYWGTGRNKRISQQEESQYEGYIQNQDQAPAETQQRSPI